MRYYSSSTGEMVLQGAIAAGDTTLTVDTTAGLPVAYPYTLFLDYGSASEEIVDVTAAAGTTLTVARGKDGSVAQSHAFGAKIRHGISGRDLRESRDHEAATGAHGVATVVGATEAQTLDNKTFQPTGDHAAAVVRTLSANTAPAVDVRDQADARSAGWFADSLAFFFGANAVARLRQGGAVNVFKSILELRVSDDIHSVVGTVSGTPTGRFLRLMSGATELFYVAATGALKATGVTSNGDVSVTGNVTASGNVTATGTVGGSNITTMASDISTNATNITSVGNRVTTLETSETLTTAAPSYGTGFAIATTGPDPVVVKKGGLVTVSAKIRRSSGTGTVAFQIPAGFRPNATAYTPNVGLAVQAWNGGTTEGPQFICTVDPATGQVNLSQISNGQTWDTGTFIQITGSYFV